MRFLLSIHGWYLGGFATFCQNLSVGLRQQGHEVKLLVLPETELRGDLPAGVFDDCVVVPRRLGGLGGHVVKVARAIGRLDPEILVLNDVPYGMAALPLLRREMVRLPVIHSVAPDEVELGLSQGLWWDRVVAVSEFVARAALAKDSSARVAVCPSGVPGPLSRAKRQNPTGEHPIKIISVGRVVVHQKRMDRLPAIARLLAEQGIAYHWTVLGDGEYLPRLRQQLKEFGLESCFHLAGAVAQPAVREALQEAEVFVMPSDCEGMPQALLEAMAEGVVPVVSRIAGSTTWVEKHACGYLCEPSQAIEFASAIAELARNRGRGAELGGRAATYIAQHFSLEAFTQRFLTLVAEVQAQPLQRPAPLAASQGISGNSTYRCLGFWRSLRHQSLGQLKRWVVKQWLAGAGQPRWEAKRNWNGI